MSKGTTRRSVRVAAPLWEAATSACAANGETVTDVIRRALEAYVAAGNAEARVRQASRRG